MSKINEIDIQYCSQDVEFEEEDLRGGDGTVHAEFDRNSGLSVTVYDATRHPKPVSIRLNEVAVRGLIEALMAVEVTQRQNQGKK